MHNELDKLLIKRAVPEMPYGLSERIIAAAYRARQQKKWSLADFAAEIWQGFAETLVLPKPAFALSLMLLTGFILGMSAKGTPSFAGSDEITSYGIADESYEDGKFL